MKHATPLLLVLGLLLSLAATSQALFKVPVSKTAAASTLVFEGTVVSSASQWNDRHTMIFTIHQVRPTRVFKGAAGLGNIEVVTMGGIVDNYVITVSELLSLSPGETGVFFCYPDVSGLKSASSGKSPMGVYASSQGFIKYDLASGRASSPFEKYTDIESGVYPSLEKLTGRSSVKVDADYLVSSFRSSSPAGKLMAPAISSFSPATLVAGKYSDPASNTLVITGTGFGVPGGSARIAFDDANNGTGGASYDVPSTSDLIISWTDTRIEVLVPGRAGTGLFTVYDAANTGYTSATPLEISWAALTLHYPPVSPSNLMFSLFNQNGSGGYTYQYSDNTANSGVNFSTSPQEAPFRRAITTWQQLTGVNFTYGGTTSVQVADPYDGVNVIMLDNTNNGTGGVLVDGTLGVCISSGYICNGSRWIIKAGFDIIIRNAGVSAGSTNFNNGPCATTGSAIDIETMILHELGHALNLAHINDNFKGSFLPNIDPGKLMNFALVNGVDRRSPDWAAMEGARYHVNPRGLSYCAPIGEMTPLPGVTAESKDECPLMFPSVATPDNTSVSFDLDHATSNRLVDPQFTRVFTSGAGTSITNNAWYVFRTGAAANVINLSVSGYSTNPASQAACSSAGVELSFYQVNSCPGGQSFPAPVAYRSFNSDGAVTAVTGLSPNTSYLVMADGIFNTRARFTLNYIGNVLPVRFLEFQAKKENTSVSLDWQVAEESGNDHFEIESGTDGQRFNVIGSVASNSDNGPVTNYSFTDNKPFPGINYYRLRQADRDGKSSYSKTLLVDFAATGSVSIYPNPAAGKLYIRSSGNHRALQVSVYTINGSLLTRRQLQPGLPEHDLDLRSLRTGIYIAEVLTSSGVQRYRFIKE